MLKQLQKIFSTDRVIILNKKQVLIKPSSSFVNKAILVYKDLVNFEKDGVFIAGRFIPFAKYVELVNYDLLMVFIDESQLKNLQELIDDNIIKIYKPRKNYTRFKYDSLINLLKNECYQD